MILQPLATLTFSPLDFKNSFALIDSFFEQFKLKILYAESHFSPIDPASSQNGITVLSVFTACDDAIEKSFDHYLRSQGIGYLEGHQFSNARKGKKQNCAKWVITVGGGRA
jgi:hypothetical protein